MDLLTIIGKIWRHKLVTLPVILLTIVAAGYVVAVKKPVYEAKSSFVLLNPPAAPTAEDIARDPELGRIKPDNPYTRFGDQSVIIQVLASTMSGDQARHALVKAGADERYTVAPSAEFGYSSPIVQVTAIGWTADIAMKSANLVRDAATRELDRMQSAQGVDKRYRIKALEVDAPDQAELQASGQLRMLVGMLVLGAVGLFMVVSIADALETLGRERMERRNLGRWAEPTEEPWDLWTESPSSNGHAHPVPHGPDGSLADERERS